MRNVAAHPCIPLQDHFVVDHFLMTMIAFHPAMPVSYVPIDNKLYNAAMTMHMALSSAGCGNINLCPTIRHIVYDSVGVGQCTSVIDR